MKWSILTILAFAIGILIGRTGIVADGVLPDDISIWLLCVLILQVGIGIGSSDDLGKLIRGLDIRSILVPLGTVTGSLLFALPACLIFRWISWSDGLAIAGGMGYYSLSSVLITDLKTPELGLQMASALGTVALLANIFRELTALGLAPLFRKLFGPYGPVAAAGVTSVDVLMPSIIRYSGKEMIPTALANGVLLDLSVPVLVSFFCML